MSKDNIKPWLTAPIWNDLYVCSTDSSESSDCSMNYTCILCGGDVWAKGGVLYCQIRSCQKNSTIFVNKPSEEPATNGNQEEKPSRLRELNEAYTNALAALNLNETGTSSSITWSPLSESPGQHNLLESMRLGFSATKQDLPSSAPNAIEQKQNEKTENVGRKADQDKPALAYIPKAALYAEGEAFSYGAKKYAAWNYKNGISVTRTLGAALRHLLQFLDGEDKDAESGTHHLGCARANIAMALDTLENHPSMDDRYKAKK
jgi:Domain of unknown function (DUF5664)